MPDQALNDDEKIAAAINDLGWRTGSACALESLAKHFEWMRPWTIARIKSDASATWVPFISSQACDLVNPSLTNEPHAEFILGRIDVKADPGIALNRTYRRLQLRRPKRPFAEFNVHDRWLVDRQLLLELPRAAELDLDWPEGMSLAAWVGGRYARYPLPNELARRMAFDQRVKGWLKALNNDVEEIRVTVTPADRELADGEVYNVVMFIILSVHGFSSDKAKAAHDRFEDWLSKLKGVTVQLRVVSADRFSYQMLKATYRLDVDAVTFGHLEGPFGATPAGN